MKLIVRVHVRPCINDDQLRKLLKFNVCLKSNMKYWVLRYRPI